MAHSRTYIPQLLTLLRVLCKYLVKYRAKLDANTEAGGSAAIDAVMTACEALIALCPVPEPVE